MEKKNLREKIELRMQVLEEMMKRQLHIHDPNSVDMFLDRIRYCWAIMSEEDKDFVQGCQTALEEKIEWSL